MVQVTIIFCLCLATADLVGSHSHLKMDCCADVKSRLAAIEQVLQQITLGGNAVAPTTTPTATPAATPTVERDPLRTCKETLDQGFTESGVYTIDPDDGYGPFEVYCDMETDGGGWAVFQRREDGSVDFYRDWVDYKNGFGDLKKEFWLGLDKISRLTKESPQTIRFDLSDFDGNSRYAQYKTFEVGNEASGYVLNIGSYSGNAGDSFTFQNGMKFSTRDKEQDTNPLNCAVLYKGAWWYSNCHYSNLNGFYRKGVHETYADGVNWRDWKGYHYSLKFTEMKVRPK